MDNNFKPISITTTEYLSEEIILLIEAIAKDVHNVWASGRYNDGWRFGEKRNDDLKHHPSITPYELLSESEKEYDRRTVITTINSIIDYGFEIKKKDQ